MRRSSVVLKHQRHFDTNAATWPSDGDRQEEGMSRPAVVIADDNEWVRDLVKSALEPCFAIERSVGDGGALVDAVVAHEPDAVVAEIGLPVIDGLDAMDSLRELGHMVPFVMIGIDPDAAEGCLAAGAAAFVCKANIGRELAQAVFFACAIGRSAGLERIGSRDGAWRQPWHSRDAERFR